ncbi:MarR family winged helix-turn-helix transcriptional regulator [Microbacterium sp. NPDC056044]|uniref:MarR family winged helix-turn-helix transcriptional regulator n=1 Tax=Microbacterium sp. NPDC056044 TaxID=3345690 RepID=UPI0035DA1CD0
MSNTQLLDTLLALSTVLAADEERELERRGLTRARVHLLWVIHHQGPRTQAEIATALQVTPRNVTTLVDALEATGFAQRTPHPQDRRAVRVTLTERGRDVMARMDAEHEEFGAALTEGLDPATAEATVIGLQHVLARLTALVAEHAAASEAGRAGPLENTP